MCSSRWLVPAWASDSIAEPVPIQNPSATERTFSMRSVITRTPFASVVVRCWVISSGPDSHDARAVALLSAIVSGPVPGTARAALALAAGATAIASVAPRAIAWGTTATTAAAAGGDTRELLDGLAR